MSEQGEINPDAPTPWVLCPICACSWLRIQAVLERGAWVDDSDRYEFLDEPRVGSFVAGDQGQAVECVDCGHRFDLSPGEDSE